MNNFCKPTVLWPAVSVQLAHSLGVRLRLRTTGLPARRHRSSIINRLLQNEYRIWKKSSLTSLIISCENGDSMVSLGDYHQILCRTWTSLCHFLCWQWCFVQHLAFKTVLSRQIVKSSMGSSMESADDKVKQKILNRIELKCLEMKELMLSQR